MRVNMFYIISYDIVDTKKRTKLARYLEGRAVRVQKSVFEAVWNQKLFIESQEKLITFLNPKTDSLRIYRICANCQSEIFSFGTPSVYDDVDLEII